MPLPHLENHLHELEIFNKRVKEILAKRKSIELSLASVLPSFLKEIAELRSENSKIIDQAKRLAGKGFSLPEKFDELCNLPFSVTRNYDEGQRKSVYKFVVKDPGIKYGN